MNLAVRKPNYRAVNRPSSIDQVFDQFFNRNLGDFFGSDFVNDAPSVNITELDHQFKIELAAPGLEKGDFNIKVEEDHLIISAEQEHKNEEKDEAGKFLRREFSYATFSRSFRLPENVDAENISANYKNGVLVLELPKAEPVNNTRVIEIQ
ncbi:MAG TPA: Hsp20/alpha crystallin family protein [Saprospiraceae bacterium]|nr:Hsp20/alpha crystallin family protein [Saprospiraceae bacterium]